MRPARRPRGTPDVLWADHCGVFVQFSPETGAAKPTVDGEHSIIPRATNGLQIDGERIAIHALDGRLLVQDGAYAPWIEIARSIKSYQLEGDRIAVHTDDDRLLVKDGAIDAAWEHVASWLKSYQLEGDRIAYHTSDDRLMG